MHIPQLIQLPWLPGTQMMHVCGILAPLLAAAAGLRWWGNLSYTPAFYGTYMFFAKWLMCETLSQDSVKIIPPWSLLRSSKWNHFFLLLSFPFCLSPQGVRSWVKTFCLFLSGNCFSVLFQFLSVCETYCFKALECTRETFSMETKLLLEA